MSILHLAAPQNGYSTTLNEKEVVIHRGDGTVAASGTFVNDLYVLAIRVCIPRHTAEVHLATQTETFQVWHEHLGHQNKCRVMKVLKQHGINVEANKEFVMVVLWEKHISRASELGQADQA